MPSASDLKLLIAAMAPGLIILVIRQWFVAAPRVDIKERAISYAALSAVYYAIVNPIFSYIKYIQYVPTFVADASEYVVLPCIIGLIVAVGTYRDWTARWWRLLKIQPIHPSPTAWDYVFSRMGAGEFLLITLNDSSQIGGVYAGMTSFASSINDQRDLLIGEVYEWNGGRWLPAPQHKSILLCGRDIRTIEFFHGERTNEADNTSASTREPGHNAPSASQSSWWVSGADQPKHCSSDRRIERQASLLTSEIGKEPQ